MSVNSYKTSPARAAASAIRSSTTVVESSDDTVSSGGVAKSMVEVVFDDGEAPLRYCWRALTST